MGTITNQTGCSLLYSNHIHKLIYYSMYLIEIGHRCRNITNGKLERIIAKVYNVKTYTCYSSYSVCVCFASKRYRTNFVNEECKIEITL